MGLGAPEGGGRVRKLVLLLLLMPLILLLLLLPLILPILHCFGPFVLYRENWGRGLC